MATWVVTYPDADTWQATSSDALPGDTGFVQEDTGASTTATLTPAIRLYADGLVVGSVVAALDGTYDASAALRAAKLAPGLHAIQASWQRDNDDESPLTAAKTINVLGGEEENDPMPANTTLGAGPTAVPCSTSAWAQLDVSRPTSRLEVDVLNTSTTDPLGIIVTSTSAQPAAGTPASWVVQPNSDWLPLRVSQLLYVWGKSLGSASITAQVTQLGN